MAEQGTRRHTEMGVGHVTHVGHAEALAIQRRHGACGDRLGARVGRESGRRHDAPPPPRRGAHPPVVVLPPWRPRAVMVAGDAEALTEAKGAGGEPLGAIIRIHPVEVVSRRLDTTTSPPPEHFPSRKETGHAHQHQGAAGPFYAASPQPASPPSPQTRLGAMVTSAASPLPSCSSRSSKTSRRWLSSPGSSTTSS